MERILWKNLKTLWTDRTNWMRCIAIHKSFEHFLCSCSCTRGVDWTHSSFCIAEILYLESFDFAFIVMSLLLIYPFTTWAKKKRMFFAPLPTYSHPSWKRADKSDNNDANFYYILVLFDFTSALLQPSFHPSDTLKQTTIKGVYTVHAMDNFAKEKWTVHLDQLLWGRCEESVQREWGEIIKLHHSHIKSL